MDHSPILGLAVVVLLGVSAGVVGAIGSPSTTDSPTLVTGLQDGGTAEKPIQTARLGGSEAMTPGNASPATEPPRFGVVVSSFIQTTTAAAEAEVSQGLFEAKFEQSNASQQAQLVRKRTIQLDNRVSQLRDDRKRLLSRDATTVRARAEAASLTAQSDSIIDSLNMTVDTANRAGVTVDGDAIDGLRSDTQNITGPQVAELARGLPMHQGPNHRGPSSEMGPDVDGGETETNQTTTESRPTD